jgi:chromosome segregation ATPase
MGYRPQIRSPRDAGRGHQASQYEKKKAREKKHRSRGKYLLEESIVPTPEEAVEKTLGRLRNLGNQTFAFFPFSEYLDDWLVNLKGVLTDFESNPSISVDEQFMNERSQILSSIELELEERRRKETFLEESLKSLSNSKTVLERIEEEYATRTREIEGRKNSEIKRLNGQIASFKEELAETAELKAGIFRAVSRKAKAQKLKETTQKLDAAQRELASVTQNSTAEQEKLRDEYERKKPPVIEQIRAHEKEVEHAETDGSLEDRRLACNALINAVKALLQRKQSSLQ